MSIRVLVRLKADRACYQLYYVDPLTGRDVTRSAGTENVREAERAAALWQDELEKRGITSSSEMTWERFRATLDDEHLASLSKKSRLTTRTALNHFERIHGKVRRIDLIDAAVISRFSAALRDEDMAATSIAAHLRSLKAALGWAARVGYLPFVPRFVMPKTTRGQGPARSRAVTDAEFETLLAAVPTVRPDDLERWKRYLRGLWFSGLRLAESLILSWDAPPFRVELSGSHPHFVIWSEGQKSRKDQVLPMAPEFAALLRETPGEKRTGLVFPLGEGAAQRSTARVGEFVSDIGEAAGIVVADGKFASAHDLRRAFGTRWASRVMPPVLQQLMRHSAIETTLRYYVHHTAADLGQQIADGYAKCCTPDCTPGAPRKAKSKKKNLQKQGK